MVYTNKNRKVLTEKGAIYCWENNRSLLFWLAVSYVQNNTPHDATVVVIPEGIGINFFAERENPLRYNTFLPPDLAVISEDTIIEQLARANIGYVLIANRDTSEYGYATFGVDYGKKMALWIYENYTPIKQLGTLSDKDDSGFLILKKNGMSV